MTGFWRKWLIGWCWAVIAFGAVLSLGGFAATKAPVEALFRLMNPGATTPFDATAQFSAGLMGAVSLGWGLSLLATVREAIRLGPDARSLWGRLLVATVIWYAIDSSISVANGFALNAASNTVLLVGLLLPLWRSGVLASGEPARA